MKHRNAHPHRTADQWPKHRGKQRGKRSRHRRNVAYLNEQTTAGKSASGTRKERKMTPDGYAAPPTKQDVQWSQRDLDAATESGDWSLIERARRNGQLRDLLNTETPVN